MGDHRPWHASGPRRAVATVLTHRLGTLRYEFVWLPLAAVVVSVVMRWVIARVRREDEWSEGVLSFWVDLYVVAVFDVLDAAKRSADLALHTSGRSHDAAADMVLQAVFVLAVLLIAGFLVAVGWAGQPSPGSGATGWQRIRALLLQQLAPHAFAIAALVAVVAWVARHT